jgi:hypothetical protein
MYGIPVFIAAIRQVPPERFAWLSLSFSMLVGAVAPRLLIPTLAARWPWLIVPEAYPLALGLGLAINPLTPILLRRAMAVAETFNTGAKK